jgi:hypothetical protein
MTCQSSSNVTGAFTCEGLTALNSTIPSVLFTTSSTVFNIPSSTISSVSLTTSSTIYNIPKSTIPSVLLTTSGTISNNNTTVGSANSSCSQFYSTLALCRLKNVSRV